MPRTPRRQQHRHYHQYQGKRSTERIQGKITSVSRKFFTEQKISPIGYKYIMKYFLSVRILAGSDQEK